MTNCYTCSAIKLHLLIKSGRGPSLYIGNATKQATLIYSITALNKLKTNIYIYLADRGIISGMQSYMSVKTGNI